MIRVEIQNLYVIVVYFLTFYSNITLTSANPVISSDVQAMEYLQKFGYMNESISSISPLISEDVFSTAIKQFQNFAGLDETGELDDTTLTMMNTPRCGIKDNVKQNETTMGSYVSLGSKWKVKDLTYRVSKYSRVLKDKGTVDNEIARAFKVWSDVSSLKFTNKTKGKVDIDIRFEVRSHGDRDPFDGPGNVLAHAIDPRYGGDACFDDEERWTVNRKSGINLFQVAAHEFGHSLGLGHSKEKKALMAPFYQGYQSNFRLHNDDIQGIQKLYGRPRKESPTPTAGLNPGQTPNLNGAPDICHASAFDAATKTEDGRTYIFKDDYYWEILSTGIADGYPKNISNDWSGLPGNVDAAMTWSDGKTFFFKKNEYWRFRNKEMDPGYPKDISAGFKGIPESIDAAVVWNENEKTYFFKGGNYWRYDSESEPPVKSLYTQLISNWVGLPNNIDAALQWTNEKTYFFKDKVYYRFNDKSFSVDTADPPYPRSTPLWWFGCQDEAASSKASLESNDQKPVYVGRQMYISSSSSPADGEYTANGS